MNQKNKPIRILVTMGEAAGIGPELLVKIAQIDFSAQNILPVQLIVLADGMHLKSIAKHLSLSLSLTNIDWDSPAETHKKQHLWIEEHSLNEKVEPGKLNVVNAKTTLAILERASELALNKHVDAIVTTPVHKANLNKINSDFLGHTEFFANKVLFDQTSINQSTNQVLNNQVVMMLATRGLRMILATTHIPLAQVSQSITFESLKAVLQSTLNDLEKYKKDLKIAVCGLNPHAGEEGLLGKEDQEIIQPVVKYFQQQGKKVFGPFPADTLFTPEKREAYDVFLAMYHDQGLPVIKTLGFGKCVNVTLGLPYIRTSVDHGTALDIANTYTASATSLEYAINYAVQLVSGSLPE